MIRLVLLMGLILGFAWEARANRISMTNCALQPDGPGTASVEVEVAWENSWRASWEEPLGVLNENWDAAWIFLKYRTAPAMEWCHASLSLNAVDHVASAGTSLVVGRGTKQDGASFGCGVFLYRSGEGSGNWGSRMRLRWNYAQDRVASVSGVELRLHALEMVFVPTGSFYVGSGGRETGSFTDGQRAGGNTIPLQIRSEAALRMAPAPGCLWGTALTGWMGIGPEGELPAAYPKGYRGFYCMKYELTQGQYADFLNELTPAQAAQRYPEAYNQSGFTIRREPQGTYRADAPSRACNFLNWLDALAYAAWAGLRPMSELEFEKACRGPLYPAPGEWAWGNAEFKQLKTLAGLNGGGAETALPSGANCNFGAAYPTPVRGGLFATATSNRMESGATYWGILEMSGNVWERAVTVGRIEGRKFSGEHGRGELNPKGEAEVSGWPGPAGGSLRGGGWGQPANSQAVSCRELGIGGKNGLLNYGFRGVHTAPEALNQAP